MKRTFGAFGVLGGILIACGGSDGAIGPEGLHGLVDTAPEAPGPNCPQGGTRLRAGVDDNRNGVLDDDEVDSTSYLCNGTNGNDGLNGKDGLTTLTAMTDEPPGANCTHGGKKVQIGTDDDRDGVLDPNEVDQTAYLCNGKPGTNGMVNVSDEPAGTNCPAGGKKIETGIDDDGDGVLEASEIDHTSYVCNGTNGSNGLSTLVALTNEPAGTQCPYGGKKIEAGIDDDGDGVLEASEVEHVGYVCNGPAGANGMIHVTDEPPGTNCEAGGKKIASGTDDDGDGVLEASEIDHTSYVCNGKNGADGSDALTNLVSVSDELAGPNCKNGGKKILTGLDDNANGVLDPSEIDQTFYICNILSCEGKVYKDACWHLGAMGESCTKTCEKFGGYDEATRTIVGDLGSPFDCQAVMELLGSSASISTGASAFGNTGCGYYHIPGLNMYVPVVETTADGSYSQISRACACMY